MYDEFPADYEGRFREHSEDLYSDRAASDLNYSMRERERDSERCGTGILFEEPNPTGSRPSDLIGLYRRGKGERPQPAKRSCREEGGGDRGSTAARPTLTRDWGGPQVRDPAPIVSVNDLFERGTEHLWIRPPNHGIGGGPRSPASETVVDTPQGSHKAGRAGVGAGLRRGPSC